MKIFEANISYQTLVFLTEFLKNITSFEIANQKIFDAFGIKYFFDKSDFLSFIKSLSESDINLAEEPDRAEYGDFQTNKDLANKVAKNLLIRNISPEIVIEPTCGKGNFINC